MTKEQQNKAFAEFFTGLDPMARINFKLTALAETIEEYIKARRMLNVHQRINMQVLAKSI